MNDIQETIGFGGSCHWCTEAIFQSLKGVKEVQQGWIASESKNSSFSEAVIVVFNPEIISLHTLIKVHLYTHSCTSNHTLRNKYRSAIYTFNETQALISQIALNDLQAEFKAKIITAIMPFQDFRLNKDEFLNYYYNGPDKPFCENVINPKLRLLMKRFSKDVNTHKLTALTNFI